MMLVSPVLCFGDAVSSTDSTIAPSATLESGSERAAAGQGENQIYQLLFRDGYAVPYQWKRANINDLSMDWGGSMIGYLRWDFDQDKNDGVPDLQQRVQRYILYIFSNVRYGEHFHYFINLRNRYHFDDYAPGAYSNEGVDIDQMYGEATFEPFAFKAGRQFQKLGRGHVLRANYDAMKLTYSDDFVDLDFFIGHLLGSNQDVYLPYNRQQKRIQGVNATIKEFQQHVVQGYVVGVRDRSDDGLSNRDSHYEPVYFGLYGIGRFDVEKHCLKNIGYYGEMIRVAGFSNASDLGDPSTYFSHEPIHAWLLDYGAILRFKHDWKPEWENEIMMASGDKSVTPPLGRVGSTRFGNPAGSPDSNFRDIDGFVNYGAALNPREANMIVYKSSWSAKPIKRLQVGLDYYKYWKVKGQGVVSELKAVDASRQIGDELDVTATFNINKTTRLDAVYGHFFSGPAIITPADDEDVVQIILSTVF